ncbi:MAG: PQQ-binding-like beta-propeller repeat protein [Phycisphaerae bacterium]
MTQSNLAMPPAVVPILVGPLQVLLALLPYILMGLVALVGSILTAIFRPWKLLMFIWVQKLPLLVVGAIVAGLWVMFSHISCAVPQTVSQAVSGKDWPVWRGGVDRRGAVSGDPDPVAGGIQWQFVDGDSRTFYCSPAVVGNRVYATSARYEVFADRGAIYSLDADTGRVVWKYDADKYRATFSSPAVAGRYLAVGEGLHETRNARIICLDVKASEEQRKPVKLWDYQTNSHVESSPCVQDGKVCVGAGDDGVYCLAADGDGKGGPKVLWHLDGKEYPDCEASPVIFEGKAYFSQGEEGQAITCVDAADGKQVWQIKTPCPVFGAPSIADGRLYAAMGTGNFVKSAEQLAADERERLKKAGKTEAQIEAAVKALAPMGEVWCVDLKTHEVLWKYKTPKTVLGAAAVADGRIYFGSSDGYLYCVSADGKLVNKWDSHAEILSSPAVANDHVYFVTKAGRLHALESKSLKPVWEIGLSSASMSSPAVARGRVFVGTDAAGLICAGKPGDQSKGGVWAGNLGGPGSSGWVKGSILGDRGKFLWRYPPGVEGSESPAASISAVPAFIGNACYLGIDAKDKRGLVKLVKSGDAAPVEQWTCPSDNPVYLSAAATDELALFVDGKQGDAGRCLRCLDAKSGNVLWRIGVDKEASGRFFIAGDMVVIADKAGGLSAVSIAVGRSDKDRVLWSRGVGTIVDTPAAGDGILVAAVSDKPKMIAMKLGTGEPLWERPLASPPRTGPVITGQLVWAGVGPDIAGFDLPTGREILAIPCKGAASLLVTDGERLACINDASQVVVIDLLGTKPGIEPIYVPRDGDTSSPKADGGGVPVLGGDTVLYFGGDAIQQVRLPSPRVRAWCPIDWLGKPAAPMVVYESQVYFVTDKMGLCCAGAKERP